MPKIDMNEYNNAKESQGGGFAQPEPGVYKLRIMAVRTEWEEYDFQAGGKVGKTSDEDRSVQFVYDIDDGEFEGEYSRDFFMDGTEPAPNKDWMHQTKYGWWNLGRLKLQNNVLATWNPGFDPMAAFQADRWDMFVGKKFAAVVNGTVSTNDNGFDNWRLRCGDWITPEQLASGDHKEPKVTDKRRKPTAQANDDPFGYGDDLPFV